MHHGESVIEQSILSSQSLIGSGTSDALTEQDLHISSETTYITYINHCFGKARNVKELHYLDRKRDVTILLRPCKISAQR